jgi:beta-phosphoglucomutase-like phosphatase (HAD superfamily)
MKGIKAYLFDFDGTILDSKEAMSPTKKNLWYFKG